MHLAHRHRRAARRIVIKMAAVSRQVYLFSVRRSDIGPCADAFFSRPDPRAETPEHVRTLHSPIHLG